MKKNTWTKHFLRYENLAVVYWLASDILWLMNLRSAAVLMIVPMMAVAVDATLRSQKNNIRLACNVTLSYWFAANATWMTGEYFKADMLALYAWVFYFAGLAVAVASIILMERKRSKKLNVNITTETIYRGISVRMNKAA